MTITSSEPRAAPVAPADPPAWQHVAALDGLRALAVVAVLLFHGGYLQGGFLGVDLFFALSGFLITSLLIRDAGTAGGVRLTAFWGRRFRRLLPAVLTLIVIVALWSWLFGSLADLAGVEGDGPWALFYGANWHFIAQSGGYWESFTQPSMFDHLWSLAIEEQFYLLWPLAVVAIWRWSRRPVRTLAVVSSVAIGLSFVAMVLLYHGGEPTRVYMGTDTRAASLLVGALAATEPARRLARRACAALGDRLGLVLVLLAGLVAWSWVAVDGASSGMLYRGGLLAHSMACAVVISLVVAAERGWFVRGLGWRPLAWIGVLSYGLYLWHWPVYVVLSPDRMGFGGVTLLGIRILVSLALAYASYRLIEGPVRHRAMWARGRSGVVVLVTVVIGVVLLLRALPDPSGQVAEFDPSAIAAAAPLALDTPGTAPATSLPTRRPAPTDAAVEQAAAPPARTVPPTTAIPVPRQEIHSVMWAGDSVSYDLAPAVVASLTAAGLDVDTYASYFGLRLIADGTQHPLAELIPQQAAKIRPEVVLMQVSLWDISADDDTYRAALEQLAGELNFLGSSLVLVAAPPTGRHDLNDGATRLFGVATELAARSATDNIEVIDFGTQWHEGAIDFDGDGIPERKRDDTHVCPSGAARFGVWLTQALDDRYDGLTPGDPFAWAAGSWTGDPRYDDPVGACARL